jgi:membrane fusion protein (multidrug efflux system)
LEAQRVQAEAALEQARAKIASAEANQEQARANLTQATAQAERNARNAQRYRSLRDSTPEAVAQDQLDQASTEERGSNAQRDAAAQQFKASQAQVVGAHADEAQAQAKIAQLKAQQEQAQLTLGYTKIIAPVDGHIAQKSIAVGTYVAPGQQILAIVPLQVWITANMKETQLAHMREGQSVSVDVDSCPDVELTGHVDSIQRGAGQAFSLLPPENATGNYVKVVQRVPVKIVLDTVPRDCVLGPGMSVVPTVRVR